VPKSVETAQGGKVTVLWNQQVQTDRTIPNNKPDIIIHDNEKACWPLVPKFAGSNLAEAVGFLRAKKSPARLPSEGK